MRITQLTLEGRDAWPDLQIDAIKPALNVFYGQPQSGKSTVAQLVSHLLYGKEASSWRQQFGRALPRTEGTLTVENSNSSFVLRRNYDSNCETGEVSTGPDSTGQLTIAACNGTPVNSQTVHSLLSGLSPEMAKQLLAVDFAEPPRIEWLLSETFAREFTHRLPGEKNSISTTNRTCCSVQPNSPVDQIDHRRVEELIRQRDSIAQELTQQVDVRRHESDQLERELHGMEQGLQAKRERSQELQAKLRGIEGEIAETKTHIRYFSLSSHAHHSGNTHPSEPTDQKLIELDAEIAVCRDTLRDLQLRERVVRTELAQIGPDGTADSVTCVADSRATLGVLEQLLGDLDAEVSQLARANEPGCCAGHDAHARLVPVTHMLRDQVYTLCGQLTEQQRFISRQQLTQEIRQLGRVQVDMGERLEQLLSRRQSLVCQTQWASQTALFRPQLPVADHCRCDHHRPFVEQSDLRPLGRRDRNPQEGEPQDQLSTLERTQTSLMDELNSLNLDIDRLAARWKELQSDRIHLLSGTVIEKQQAEIDRLEKMIEELLNSTNSPTTAEQSTPWRASDILAQLTDGNLVQIRLQRHNRRAMVVDRSGRTLEIESLSTSQHDQLYLALTLALVSSSARRGIRLPLLLDEPFLRQDAASAAILAGVLDDFARAGHQVLVFTEDQAARRRFTGLGSTLIDLEALRRSKPDASPATTFAAALTTKHSIEPSVTTSRRVVRETFDGHTAPALSLATVSGPSDNEELFYLKESSSWNDFPVLGSETASLFGLIEIRSVGDLLAADPAKIARLLSQPDIRKETVRLWQSHMGLMCYVPDLTLNDAQLLTAVGIFAIDDLSNADLDQLSQLIEDFLSSSRGRQFASSRHRYGRSQLGRWRDGARRNRQRWQQSRSGRSNGHSRGRGRSNAGAKARTHQRSSRHSSPRSDRQSQRSNRRETKPSKKRSDRPSRRDWQFTLSRKNEVEAAPSIGPETADRLAQAGIRSVADLLSANPESVAQQLDVSHIKAKTVAAWQHQARLVCQIPELPGYGAQLLVANGFTEPEQVADTSIDELVGKILAFCQTKEGQRIMRSGDTPERDKIAEWIECAAHRRPLEAA